VDGLSSQVVVLYGCELHFPEKKRLSFSSQCDIFISMEYTIYKEKVPHEFRVDGLSSQVVVLYGCELHFPEKKDCLFPLNVIYL